MFDFARIDTNILDESRLDSLYYSNRFLKNEEKLASCSLARKEVFKLSSLCNCGSTPKKVEYSKEGVGLIRTSDVRPNSFVLDKIARSNDCVIKDSTTAKAGDMLYTMSGTIGYASVIPEMGEEFSFSNTIARIRLPENSDNDIHYISTFFNSHYGYEQSLRLTSGAIQGHVMPNPFKRLKVSLPAFDAQKYIGDKVRQAERLRARAKQLQYMITQIGVDNDINAILSHDNINYGFVSRKSIDTRLDPNYNNKRALEILNVIGSRGVVLNNIIISISNGHEDRNFVESGLRYVTGTELANNKLDISEAPQIADTGEVSSRAIANEKCVLFVRVGTVGNLCKVHSYDAGCVVSSNIINVEFENQEIAAAVCAFYQSEAGQVLLNKISFGVIQSQIGQGELLKLPVPEFFLDQKSKFLELMNLMETTSRNSYNLVKCAKLLVEGLIEGKISEAELVATQQALDTGDDSLDRALLERITAEGIDGGGAPLFDDIDQLYDLLVQADEATQGA